MIEILFTNMFCLYFFFSYSTQFGHLRSTPNNQLEKKSTGGMWKTEQDFWEEKQVPFILSSGRNSPLYVLTLRTSYYSPLLPSCPPASLVGQRAEERVQRLAGRWGSSGGTVPDKEELRLGPSGVGHWPWGPWLSCCSNLEHSIESDPLLGWCSL